jgi:hypothetical protein
MCLRDSGPFGSASIGKATRRPELLAAAVAFAVDARLRTFTVPRGRNGAAVAEYAAPAGTTFSKMASRETINIRMMTRIDLRSVMVPLEVKSVLADSRYALLSPSRYATWQC